MIGTQAMTLSGEHERPNPPADPILEREREEIRRRFSELERRLRYIEERLQLVERGRRHDG